MLWRQLVVSGTLPRSSNYAASFYSLTGLHVAHVIGGIVYLTICLMRSWTGTDRGRLRESVGNCMLYWHFVGCVWYVIFAIL